MPLLRPLVKLANNPVVMFLAGIFLVAASGLELRESLLSFEEGLQGEHATFLYGIVVAFKSLAEIDEGVRNIGEAQEDEKEKK